MNYAEIKNLDVANGKGIRVSLFVCGCRIHCKNCFNAKLQDFNYGYTFGEEQLQNIITLLANEHVDGLSILGGEPLEKENIDTILYVVKEVRKVYGNTKSIWLWTGYLYENLILDERIREIFKHVDILIDGQFIEELKDFRLQYRGSSNQRVIELDNRQ